MKLTIFLLFLISLKVSNFKSFSERKKNNSSFPFDKFSTVSNKKAGKNYRVFLLSKFKIKSFWHYINLQNSDNTYNMIVEIPKKTRAKYELSKEEKKNPIKQDIDKTTKKLRFYKIDPMFNYGFFPQTWENSAKTYFGKYKGDDDPYDVVEIGNVTKQDK
jgi:vacuolar-type H+-ATPase subunit F/Vma7